MIHIVFQRRGRPSCSDGCRHRIRGWRAINSRGITGCGVARRCRSGFKIGPLFADDTEIALQLLDGLAGACEGGDLHIDVPAPTFTTTRMAGSLMTKPDNRMPRKTAPEEISATSLALTAARGTSWLIALNRRFPC